MRSVPRAQTPVDGSKASDLRTDNRWQASMVNETVEQVHLVDCVIMRLVSRI